MHLILRAANLMFTESDLVVVGFPGGRQPILRICKALLTAEIGIDYAYQLTVGDGRALALRVEDHETATQLLEKTGFRLYTEQDLSEEP